MVENFSQTSVKGYWTVSLGLLLIASSAFGAFLLATDDHLWEHAPDHAYALIGFVFIDALLLSLLRIRRQIGIRLVPIWGSIQAVIMLADVLTAQQFGVSYFEFALDLYGNWAFDALLLARILQAIYPRIGTSKTFKVTFGRDRQPLALLRLIRTSRIIISRHLSYKG